MSFTRVKDAFPNWLTSGGIFSELQELNIPWKEAGIATELDIDYYANHSANKIVSGLVDNIVTDIPATGENLTTIAGVIFALYNSKWSKLWATMNFVYNPIENYNMVETMRGDEKITAYGHVLTREDDTTHTKTGTETETPDLTDLRTDDLTHAKTGTETETPDLTDLRTDDLTHAKTGTETETPDTEVNIENNVFGFNSSVAVPSDSNQRTETGTTETEYDTSETDTGTQTTTHTGTNEKEYDTSETDTGTQTTTHTGTNEIEYDTTESDTGSVTNTESGRDVETRNYQLTRAGNIGVTTSQQMIEAERDLWRMWDFFRMIVYPDIDRILTIDIY